MVSLIRRNKLLRRAGRSFSNSAPQIGVLCRALSDPQAHGTTSKEVVFRDILG
jgi:hypothetical protein